MCLGILSGESLVACFAAFSLCTVGIPGIGPDWSEESPRGVWTYQYQETRNTTELNLSMNGTMHLWCIGFDDISFEDGYVRTVKFLRSLSASVLGSTTFSYLSENYTNDVYGKVMAQEELYYNPETGWLISTDSKETLQLLDSALPETSLIFYSSDINETSYSGFDTNLPNAYNQGLDMEPGTSWSVEYSSSSLVWGATDTRVPVEDIDTYRSTTNSSVTIDYVCAAVESVEVPAGVYDCMKLTYNDGDSDITEWYCPAIDGYVKRISSNDDSESVQTMTEHYYIIEESNGVPHIWLILGITLVVAGAAVGILALRRGRGKTEGGPPWRDD